LAETGIRIETFGHFVTREAPFCTPRLRAVQSRASVIVNELS
jgi:hypothetical protein